MIGGWIVVLTHSPEERDRAYQDSRRAAILAQWETGTEGIRWIEHLTEACKATKLAGGAYPKLYLHDEVMQAMQERIDRARDKPC